MKKLLLVAVLGLVSSAIYARGGFSGLKNMVSKVVEGKTDKASTNKLNEHKTRSSVGQSYSYATSEREY
jgi:hypothetical protein